MPGGNATRAEPCRLRPLRLLLVTLLPSCTLLPPPMSLPSRLRLLPRRFRAPSGATSAVVAAAAAAAAAGFPSLLVRRPRMLPRSDADVSIGAGKGAGKGSTAAAAAGAPGGVDWCWRLWLVDDDPPGDVGAWPGRERSGESERATELLSEPVPAPLCERRPLLPCSRCSHDLDVSVPRIWSTPGRWGDTGKGQCKGVVTLMGITAGKSGPQGARG